MGKITTPSGREYNWSNPNPPTESDFKIILDYESALGISAQPSAPVAHLGSDAQLQSAVTGAKNIGYARASAAGGGGGFMTSPAIPEDVARETGLGILTTTARVAPAVAGAALTGGASIPVMMAAGAAASSAGEIIGQTLEKMFGKRESYSLNEIAAAGGTGAVPILPGGGVVKPIANIAMQGAGGVAGEAIRTGEFSPSEGIVPAALTSLFQVPGAVAGRVGAGFERAGQRAETVEKIGEGVQP